MENGVYRIVANGIAHWCRVAGAEHGTIPLVVVHGGPGGNVYNFERTIGPLLEQFATVLYYEQRGCGRSDAPGSPADYSIPTLVSDLEAIRTRFDLPQIILLGFSFGGELALEYALAHPQHVHKLILQAPSVADSVRSAYEQLYGFQAVATGGLKQRIEALLAEEIPPEQRLDQVWEIVDRATVDRFLFHNQEAAVLNRRLWEESGLVNTGDMHRALAAQPKDPHRFGLLPELKVPTLVLVGLYDRNVGIEVCRDLACRFPDGKLLIFEQSAHFPDMEEPAKYAATVKAFGLNW